jgi:transcriptional regulator with XRE-family HTH domain
VAVNPKPVDIHVGARVRLRRTLLGMTQTKLGDALGLTFQQVQKNERGTNRIGSSRLFLLSKILDVPVSFFFDDMAPEVAAGDDGFSSAVSNGPWCSYRIRCC